MMLKRFLFALLPAVLAASCSVQPPLYLRESVEAKIVLETKLSVDVMWQVDWTAIWQYPWDESSFGPVGYTEPKSMCLHIFPLDANSQVKTHIVHNFSGTVTELPITGGVHDLLFHNNDSEALTFVNDEEHAQVHCTTREISSGLKDSSPVMSLDQKSKTKAERVMTPEPVILTPDPLYTLFDPARVISTRLEDYEYVDGRYLLRISGDLYPATYIYLFQIKLNNNNERVIGSNGGCALTGLANGVDVKTRESHTTTASIVSELHFDRSQDLMGARLICFGLPGCNPYDEKSIATAPESVHFLVLSVNYNNGTYKNIRIDVTDPLRELPLGGVIEMTLDVDDFPPEGGTSGGGFNALIDDWKKENGGTTVTN